MKSYSIKCFDKRISKKEIKNLEKAEINIYPWEKEYCPKGRAALCISQDMFILNMEATERKSCIRAEEKGLSAYVHEDSCMEFFFVPAEGWGEYINFEINPVGAAHIAIGKDRYQRRRVAQVDNNEFKVVPYSESISAELCIWGFTAYISFGLIARMTGISHYSPRGELRGNFYICGDKTSAVHYGVWNDAYSENPDYHRPEYFGKLKIVR